MEKIEKSKTMDSSELMNSVALMPPDMAYMLLLKISMAHVAEVLTYRTPTIETYNMKEMAEILANLGECLKTSSSMSTEDTKNMIRDMANRIDRPDIFDKILKHCCKYKQ
jgi:hypothetical protein